MHLNPFDARRDRLGRILHTVDLKEMPTTDRANLFPTKVQSFALTKGRNPMSPLATRPKFESTARKIRNHFISFSHLIFHSTLKMRKCQALFFNFYTDRRFYPITNQMVTQKFLYQPDAFFPRVQHTTSWFAFFA